jgi:hypothetical protein
MSIIDLYDIEKQSEEYINDIYSDVHNNPPQLYPGMLVDVVVGNYKYVGCFRGLEWDKYLQWQCHVELRTKEGVGLFKVSSGNVYRRTTAWLFEV